MIDLDKALFHLINSGLSNGLFDALLPLVREKLFWAPLYLFLITFSLENFKWRGLAVIGGFLLTFGLTDIISARMIKPSVMRLRPCRDTEVQAVARIQCGGGYSFPSSHASNHFGAAFFLAGLFGHTRRWVKPALIAWASSVGFAQIYMGLHFPLDIAGGLLLGWIAAKFVLWLGKKWELWPCLAVKEGQAA